MSLILTSRDAYFDNRCVIREKDQTTDIIDTRLGEKLVWDLSFADSTYYSAKLILHAHSKIRSIPKNGVRVGVIADGGKVVHDVKNNVKIINDRYDGIMIVELGPFTFVKDTPIHIFIERMKNTKFSVGGIQFEALLDPTLSGLYRSLRPIKTDVHAMLRHSSPVSSNGVYHELIIDNHIPCTYYSISVEDISIGLSLECKPYINISRWVNNGDTMVDGLVIEDRKKDGYINGKVPIKMKNKIAFYIRYYNINLFDRTLCYVAVYVKTNKWIHVMTLRRESHMMIDCIYTSIETTNTNNVDLYQRSVYATNTFFVDGNSLIQSDKVFYRTSDRYNSFVSQDNRGYKLSVGGSIGSNFNGDELSFDTLQYVKPNIPNDIEKYKVDS